MLSHYQMEIFWNHGAYVAIAPDLPGCSAVGDTPMEALQELLVVMELWLQTAQEIGQTIPSSSTPRFGLENEVPTEILPSILKPASSTRRELR